MVVRRLDRARTPAQRTSARTGRQCLSTCRSVRARAGTAGTCSKERIITTQRDPFNRLPAPPSRPGWHPRRTCRTGLSIGDSVPRLPLGSPYGRVVRAPRPPCGRTYQRVSRDAPDRSSLRAGGEVLHDPARLGVGRDGYRNVVHDLTRMLCMRVVRLDRRRIEAVGGRRSIFLCTRTFRRWVEVVRPYGRWGRSVARHDDRCSIYEQRDQVL